VCLYDGQGVTFRYTLANAEGRLVDSKVDTVIGISDCFYDAI